MKYILGILLTLFSFSALAAGKTCYTAAQSRAEQAIRFHTMLMVAGMQCQKMDPTAYTDYQNFTTRNQSVIRQQENQLIGYYKQTKKAGAERAFHTFRTDLANDISMSSNGPNYGSFCRDAVAQLQQAQAMGPTEFKNWLTKLDVKGAQTLHPLCTAAKHKQ